MMKRRKRIWMKQSAMNKVQIRQGKAMQCKVRQRDGQAILDGLTEGSLLGIKRQADAGLELCRYVITARHSGSIDGKPKAEPHT
jgi:hypothetical protein